jgi:hypothetical protein
MEVCKFLLAVSLADGGALSEADVADRLLRAGGVGAVATPCALSMVDGRGAAATYASAATVDFLTNLEAAVDGGGAGGGVGMLTSPSRTIRETI